MWKRQIRWRVVASLILVGLAGDLVFGITAVTGILTTVSARTVYLLRWVPPAVERIWPTLEVLGRFRGQPAAAWGFIAIIALTSVLLSVGLWKTKKWAAWVITFLMLDTVIREGYGTVHLLKQHVSVYDLVFWGRIPALAWAIAYIAILWTDALIAAFRFAVSVVKSLRRERVVVP